MAGPRRRICRKRIPVALGKTARTAGRAAPNLLAALPFSVALSGRDALDQFATAGAFDAEREVAAHLGGQFRYNLRR
jgi:hypothetical protein